MKSIKILFLLLAAVVCSCGNGKSSQENEKASTSSTDSTLVLYYSQSGTTKAVAEEIQKLLGCDIAAIEAVQPYDGDYPTTISRWQRELADSVRPALKPLDVDIDGYTTIFLGFPIWGGTYALPMATFLDDNALEGKRIVTFATFGSGGIEHATAAIARSHPGAEVIEGYGVRNARAEKAPEEIARFLIEKGFIEGEIETYPDYSAPEAVTDTDKEIFEKACGAYQFPLGTPVKVGSRTTTQGTDYRFEVSVPSPDGNLSDGVIYVTVPTDANPEFTRVVRL